MLRASTFTAPKLLLPLAALLVTLPLILNGNSCGQDLTFHLQSWLDAAQQLRHLHYPNWDATAAWNAGEPRFLFYPPLSWLLGAVLTVILPISAAPIAFIFIAVLLSGLTFHHLARHFTSHRTALMASALYLANPYMLFNAFERSALAELLAAAWIPLLLLALLRPRPTIRGIAIPLALLWLTNVPAAIMGSYLFALLAIIRLLHSLLTRNPAQRPSSRLEHAPESLSSRPERSAHTLSSRPERSVVERPAVPPAQLTPSPSPLRLTLTLFAGAVLGLILPAFYILPAACERRFIQSEMAVIPPLRYQDNFLFTHTADAAHNAVNHTASLLALILLLLTAATLLALFLCRKKPHPEAAVLHPEPTSPAPKTAVILSEGAGHYPAPQSKDPDAASSTSDARSFLPGQAFASPVTLVEANLPPTLALLTLLIAFLLTPISAQSWRYLPELAFLQFPWRLLTLLTPLLALALALLLDHIVLSPPQNPPPSTENAAISAAGRRPQWRDLKSPRTPAIARPHRGAAGIATLLATLLLPLILSLTAHHLYSQTCDPADTPATLAHNFATRHGTLPTDEYTPTPADNDLLRTDNPGFWLVPLSNPNAPASNTVPTATELNPSIDTDDTPIPLSQTLSTPAPHHLTLNLPRPAILVLNLRNYPSWHITTTHPHKAVSPFAQDLSPFAQDLSPSAQDLDRSDGLLAIALPSGPSTIDVAWHHSPDQTLGPILSFMALLALAFTFRRPRRRSFHP